MIPQIALSPSLRPARAQRHQNRWTDKGAKNAIPQKTMPITPRPIAIHTSVIMLVMIAADASTIAIWSAADAVS